MVAMMAMAMAMATSNERMKLFKGNWIALVILSWILVPLTIPSILHGPSLLTFATRTTPGDGIRSGLLRPMATLARSDDDDDDDDDDDNDEDDDQNEEMASQSAADAAVAFTGSGARVDADADADADADGDGGSS
ncbi:hypothetical protein HZH68_016506 [Vespula germanica]|uniref:Uncharacterized protein n=1 Tax=Vespula germanica TaxID=30212 RepID=A0A834J7X3_VESGE|nr:hypothetical protein HZH68_016506 [Vespula germanica]